MAKGNTTQEMLRAIINGQSSMKQELLTEIKKTNKKVDDLDLKLSERIDKLDKKLKTRLNRIGNSVAYLERVKKIEKKLAIV